MTCTHDCCCSCPAPNSRHYVIAGRHQHAQWVATSFGWRSSEWRYVSSSMDLEGVSSRGIDIYVYEPTYRDHHDSHNIMRAVDRFRRMHNVDVQWVAESELYMNRKRVEKPISWEYPPTPVAFQTIELKEMVIPAHQVNGFRIAQQRPGTVHIISVEPTNPSDRNAPWLVRYQEQR